MADAELSLEETNFARESQGTKVDGPFHSERAPWRLKRAECGLGDARSPWWVEPGVPRHLAALRIHRPLFLLKS